MWFPTRTLIKFVKKTLFFVYHEHKNILVKEKRKFIFPMDFKFRYRSEFGDSLLNSNYSKYFEFRCIDLSSIQVTLHDGSKAEIVTLRTESLDKNSPQDKIEIIPGNSSNCIIPINVGVNYWWNNWSRGVNREPLKDWQTYFAVSDLVNNPDYPKNLIQLIENHDPLVKYLILMPYNHNHSWTSMFVQMGDNVFPVSAFSNLTDLNTFPDTAKSTIAELLNFGNGNNLLPFSTADIRLYKNTSNQIFVCSRDLKVIVEIGFRFLQNQVVVDILSLYLNYKMPKGQNFSIIKLEGNRIQFLDWYNTRDGVGVVTTYTGTFEKENYGMDLFIIDDTHGAMKRIDILEMEPDYYFNGLGSSYTRPSDHPDLYKINQFITPGLSFSGPLTPVRVGDQINYIGCAHVKLVSTHADSNYVCSSPPNQFIKNVNNDFRFIFGDRYIVHQGTGAPPLCGGYIYCIYFLVLSNIVYNDEGDLIGAELHISDAYLPVYIGNRILDQDTNDRDYKFSLVMPKSSTTDGNQFSVHCTYGDFYAVSLEFDVVQVYNSCVHNVKRMDFGKYKYHVIAYDGKDTYMDSSLRKIYNYCNRHLGCILENSIYSDARVTLGPRKDVFNSSILPPTPTPAPAVNLVPQPIVAGSNSDSPLEQGIAYQQSTKEVSLTSRDHYYNNRRNRYPRFRGEVPF